MVRLTRREAIGALAAGVAIPAAGCGDGADNGDGATATDTATATETQTDAETETGTETSGLPEVLAMPGEENPENLAVDADGRLYFGVMADAAGEVRRLSAEQTQETGLALDDATLVARLPGPVVGVEHAAGGTVYVTSLAGDETGVWSVPQDGTDPALLAAMPGPQSGGFPNDLVHDESGERLLVTDSFAGEVREVPVGADDPGTAASVWLADDRLASEEFGANGLSLAADGALYVAVTAATDAGGESAGRVLRVRVGDDGSAGDAEVFFEGPAILGADGLATREGEVYVAANQRNEVVGVSGSGETTVLADREDGLRFPSDLVFGTTAAQSGQAFVCNFANPAPEEAGIRRLSV